MKMSGDIKVHIETGVALVSIANPPVNAISRQMLTRITEVFDSLHHHPGANVAILAGTGDRAFCAGADLKDTSEDAWRTADHGRSMRTALESIYECAIPVIAAVNGPALGGGLALVAACDYAIASERATFGLPEIDMGVLGGARHAARLFPINAVRRMHYSAIRIDAMEAYRLGAVLRVVPHSRLMAEAMGEAAMLAAKMPRGLRLAKENLNAIEWMDLKNGYRFEQTRTDLLCQTRDAVEARAAYLERRPPVFIGE
ncbi:Enoyl-CoA hydratase [Denitratisoma oestradiolicum]|uniref:Enoyl-CoA hydratase n=2 Tax=Denitratisoma oestradiolicum TaxID=311182 RepID=A0A6S6XZY6_9PROT|nr:Enoyl-CoA hydratase [Denitratisoma oestradiolicum]